MNGARQHLLAGAGFPHQQHGGVSSGRHAGTLEDALHSRRQADNVLETGVPLEVFFKLRDALAQFDDLHQAGDLLVDRLEVEGLGNVVLGSPLDGVHRGFDGTVAGHDDHGHVGVAAAHPTSTE